LGLATPLKFCVERERTSAALAAQSETRRGLGYRKPQKRERKTVLIRKGFLVTERRKSATKTTEDERGYGEQKGLTITSRSKDKETHCFRADQINPQRYRRGRRFDAASAKLLAAPTCDGQKKRGHDRKEKRIGSPRAPQIYLESPSLLLFLPPLRELAGAGDYGKNIEIKKSCSAQSIRPVKGGSGNQLF